MPMNEPNYYEKIQVVVEFLEQCLPTHPGAFAAYFRVLDKLPLTKNFTLPEGMVSFVTENMLEIEKYYEGPLPDKYRPKGSVKKAVIVDVTGNPISSDEPKKLILV